MKSAITVSLVPQARGGPFVFWEGLDNAFAQAAALGFDAVEIFPPSAEAIGIAKVRELCARHGLSVAAVGTGGGWVAHKWHLCHPDAAVRGQARQFICEIIDAAAQLGAPAILGSMQGRVEGEVSREQALGWLGEALRAFGTRGAAAGQVFLYEPLNRYETNLFNRLGDAAEFLDAVGADGVKLLADLFHMNIEEASIADALRAAGSRIGHVHFADSNRRAVGFGHTEIAPIIAALREIGYAGFLSAEVLPLPDSAAAARQTIESFRRFTSR
jgi:sugar phosphate isomerase/epimerase